MVYQENLMQELGKDMIHISIEVREWIDSYIVRMNLWSEIMSGGPGIPGGELGGDID